MAYVIGANCIDVTDRACLDVCPVDCIYVGERQSTRACSVRACTARDQDVAGGSSTNRTPVHVSGR